MFEQIFLELLGINLPALIVLGIAMVVTLSQWRRHPPAARWAMLGFAWMFCVYLLAILWHSFLSHMVLGFPPGFDDQVPYLMGLSCCEGLGYLFLLLALNTARTPYRSRLYLDDFDDELPRIDR